MGYLLATVAIAIIGYLVSLRLHPLGRKCISCKGTGQQNGAIYRYAQRQCTRCGGNGIRGRYGVRILHRNTQVWGETRPARAAARRARHFGR
jgi:hypothetical protein